MRGEGHGVRSKLVPTDAWRERAAPHPASTARAQPHTAPVIKAVRIILNHSTQITNTLQRKPSMLSRAIVAVGCGPAQKPPQQGRTAAPFVTTHLCTRTHTSLTSPTCATTTHNARDNSRAGRVCGGRGAVTGICAGDCSRRSDLRRAARGRRNCFHDIRFTPWRSGSRATFVRQLTLSIAAPTCVSGCFETVPWFQQRLRQLPCLLHCQLLLLQRPLRSFLGPTHRRRWPGRLLP